MARCNECTGDRRQMCDATFAGTVVAVENLGDMIHGMLELGDLLEDDEEMVINKIDPLGIMDTSRHVIGKTLVTELGLIGCKLEISEMWVELSNRATGEQLPSGD